MLRENTALMMILLLVMNLGGMGDNYGHKRGYIKA